ncbi:Nuclease-related domain-containing protein [Arsukibacterium tuosuense]|uniref:Nuclease-related domain-containing protein n=1 Tax=Arsukibacterium tuosuense TaxID=1323745 RepID=A0A285JDW3_9GAMM|nr:nuclease-related domain-containing protein [Arsukibacterium tuosuense]SNY58462.1 Nuclease-related domain-containing protein [Arsukibacterium tuosuense]
MILKDKTQTSSASIKLDAGIKQEHDVAFYLRRAYKHSEKVMVLNDLRIEHDGESAQIDHLIAYSYGFIVVESKSIRGEVKVNEYAEWTRSYKGQWSGMPSPIKQAELQLKLLKQYLCANTEKVIGKFLGIQQGLGMRCYDVFCAISSDAIIDRTKAPKDIADKLVKSEFVTDVLDKKMNFIKFYNVVGKVYDTRPTFNQEELQNICQFLLGNTIQHESNSINEARAAWPAPTNITATTFAKPFTASELAEKTEKLTVNEAKPIVLEAITAQCKHCGDCSALSPQSGRYGYYVQCGKCGGNTPLKRPCPACNGLNTKVSRARSAYSLICANCSTPTKFILKSN